MSSDLKVTNIKHASSGSNNLVLASDGKASFSNSVGIGTASPTQDLDFGGGNRNIRLSTRSHFGSGYSTEATILGHSVKAETGATNASRMIVTETNSAGGAPTAIRMVSGEIQFHTATSGTADATFDSARMQILNNGNVLFGTTNASPAEGSGSGTRIGSNGGCQFSTTGSVVQQINRGSTDGTLVAFAHAGTVEGEISIAGTTVSYSGGHLSRYSHLPNKQKDDTILKGTVLTNLDPMCEWETETGEKKDNEQLNQVNISTVEGDPNVAGVFVNWCDFDEAQYKNTHDFIIAMTGDMIIRIANGVTVEKGQLLMSAGDGTAKPQGDDIVRNKTIAKVTSNHVSYTYDDGSFCVPCVLMAC